MIEVRITVRDELRGHMQDIKIDVENQFSSSPQSIKLAVDEALKRTIAALEA